MDNTWKGWASVEEVKLSRAHLICHSDRKRRLACATEPIQQLAAVKLCAEPFGDCIYLCLAAHEVLARVSERDSQALGLRLMVRVHERVGEVGEGSLKLQTSLRPCFHSDAPCEYGEACLDPLQFCCVLVEGSEDGNHRRDEALNVREID